jgi:hypothetical protein
MPSYSLTGGDMNEEEAAAALAAVTCLLEEEVAALAMQPSEAAPTRWMAAARLITQGLVPTRLPVAPSWSRIERLRRATRGGSGIV